ncbi:uncharacterized protein FPRO_01943 [Fusarium proliferatum ET1]|uniref:CBM-cenC domain-containing protein n=1 Tax=Fusarium proliferatum (strain ET1) TaxID=1227346 RepID=A0A1L7V3E4_FUSPR|nr:uncharacterized protein FPRO_01943 [Fusarium proliferatum ET1]CZR32810.1 uncharacterized protein FPRO_01943 [Fusarium proliferatum ET1]
MTAKTIMNAFLAALLAGDTEAGPCKPRPRTTDILTTVEIMSTSTRTKTTADISLPTTKLSSIDYLTFTTDQSESTRQTSTESKDSTTTAASPTILTTTTSSSIALTSSIIQSSVEPTTVTEDATTVAVSITLTAELSSTITGSLTETPTFSKDTTTIVSMTTETSSTRELTFEITEGSTVEPTTTEGSPTTTTPMIPATEQSSTVIESRTRMTTAAEDATTTAVFDTETSSTVEISSTIAESSVDITTSSQEPTATTSISATVSTLPTTESTTTSEVTSTTTTGAAGPPTITNLGFDDTTEPWSVTQPHLVSLSLDSNIKHDGRSSARMSFSAAGGSTSYITQAFSSPPKTGVGYLASAWIRPGDGCTLAVLGCVYGNAGLFAGRRNLVVTATATQPGTINQWQEISYKCTYTQNQIDQGGLALNIGFMCITGSEAWVDSVQFSEQ